MLAAHKPETNNSHNAQQKLGKQGNRERCNRNVTSMDELHPCAHPTEQDGSFGQSKSHECAKAGTRSQSGPRAAAWLQTRSADAARAIPAQKFLYVERQYLGIEEPLRVAATCLAYGAAGANTRLTRLSPRRRADKPRLAVRWSTRPPSS